MTLISSGISTNVIAVEKSEEVRNLLLKSENDHREYRIIQLENKLTAILVSDKLASDSAASLNIDVGQYDDPEDWDGMAHFLEHMLFLGTEKYPLTDEYKRFIDQNAGNSNAYTADDHTNYYFSIQHSAFNEALDRFSRFFIDPLFDEHFTDRERHAIQSEYNTRKTSTMRRIIAAAAMTVNPEHRGAHYGIGTLESLRDRDGLPAHIAVRRFYEQHYSSHRMNLTVVSNHAIEDLESWVRRSFSDIPQRATITRDDGIAIFNEGMLPFSMNVTPVDERHSILLQFLVPHERTNWLVRPGNYLSHLLGDEGEGSIFQSLNKKGWVKSLSASPYGLFENNRHSLFTVQMRITDEGMKHRDEIIECIFAYIKLIRDEGVNDWRFDENKRSSQFSYELFQSSSSEELAMYLSNNLLRTSPQNAMYYPYALGDFDAVSIERYLDYLIPQNLNIIIASPQAETDSMTPLWEAPYKVTALSENDIERFHNPRKFADLALPLKNPFIPQSVEQRNEVDATAPIRLDEEELAWYFPIKRFPGSKVQFNAHFRIDDLFQSAEHDAAAKILVDMVGRSLGQATYPALVAGVNTSVRLSDRGYDISISGYAQQQALLFEQTIDRLFNGTFEEDEFDFARNNLITNSESWRKDTPYQQLFPTLSAIALYDNYTKAERLKALESIDFNGFNQILPSLRNVNSIRFLAVGDALEDEARSIVKRMKEEVRDKKPLERLKVRDIGNAREVRWRVDNSDSAVMLVAQSPDSTINSHVAYTLASMLAQPQIYTDLRTNQQLGYVVQNTSFPLAGVPHFATLLQTTVVSAEDATERAKIATIAALEDLLAHLDKQIFTEAKAGFIAQLSSNPQSLEEVMNRYWYDIVSNYLEFDQEQLLAKAADEMTLDYFKKQIASLLHEFNNPLVIMAVGDTFDVELEGFEHDRQSVLDLVDYQRAAVGE